MINLIPPAYRDNLSAISRIRFVASKAAREGKFVGYWSRELSEMIGVQPADDREYGEPDLTINEN